MALSTKWLMIRCKESVSVYIQNTVFLKSGSMNVLYENIVRPSKHFDVQQLIELSEKRRNGPTHAYADGVAQLIAALKRPGADLSKQHMFKWDILGLESPCFRFEYHRALFGAYSEAQVEGSKKIQGNLFEEASQCYKEAVVAARKAANNLTQWKAICPELVRYPPFHTNYVLAMVADAKCNESRALFLKLYKNIDAWKCGVVKPEITRALGRVKSAYKWANLANILWARPDGEGGMTSSPDELETELRQQYYRVSTYAAPTFQRRLDYASLCGEFEDMQHIVALNTKLYYFSPESVEPLTAASLGDLCSG